MKRDITKKTTVRSRLEHNGTPGDHAVRMVRWGMVIAALGILAYSTPGGPANAQDNGPTPGNPDKPSDAGDLEEPAQSGSPGPSGQLELPGLESVAPQGASPQGVSPPDKPAFVMEEIVVTARKREQPAFEVPLSLSTIQEAKSTALRSSGMDLRFLSNRVPSLHMESSYGRVFPRFYIRGLGNTDFDLNASQPVSVVYDGIVLENAMLKGYPAFDLDRIEVLRGPQGSLFGRNTPAGIVKLESARPTREPEGFGRMGYGRFNSVNFEGAVSGPLGSSKFTARLSVLVQRRGDWVDNEYDGPNKALGGYRELAGRLQLHWEPTSDFETLVNIRGRELEGSARLFRANVIEPDRGGLVEGFSRDRIAIDGRNTRELNAHGMTVEVRYRAGAHELVSLTGMERLESFSRGDIDGGFGAVFSPPSGPGEIPFPSETAGGIPFLRQISQEIRLLSQEHRPLDYQFGLYYLHESVDVEDFNYDTLAGGTADGVTRQHQEAEVWAAFLATTLHLGDALEIGGGLRFSRDAKDYTAWRDEAPAATRAGSIGPIHREPTASAWSGDLSMRYSASPGVQTYVRAARGFRAPSIQGRLLFGDLVSVAGTETIHFIEGGTKMRLWDGRLRLDLAAFHYRLRNQQLTAVGGETNFNRLVNADRTLGRGFEAELALAPLGRIADHGRTELQPYPYRRRRSGHPGLRRAVHRTGSPGAGARFGADRRQRAAPGAQVDCGCVATLPGGPAGRIVRGGLGRSGLPQRGAFLPLRLGGVSRRSAAGMRRAPLLSDAGHRDGDLAGRPQRLRRRLAHGRHRFQQPDRFRQRTALLGG